MGNAEISKAFAEFSSKILACMFAGPEIYPEKQCVTNTKSSDPDDDHFKSHDHNSAIRYDNKNCYDFDSEYCSENESSDEMPISTVPTKFPSEPPTHPSLTDTGIEFLCNEELVSTFMSNFRDKCIDGQQNATKFYSAVADFVQTAKERKFCLVEIYNEYIGFALLEEKLIDGIHQIYKEHLELYPNAKLVDLGTGTGVYPWLLHQKGISKNRLVAVDVPLSEAKQQFKHMYWDNILRDKEYTPNCDDMVLISWGFGRYPSFDRYLLSGGKRVAIIGEYDGCTFPVKFFTINWDSKSIENEEDVSYDTDDEEDVNMLGQKLTTRKGFQGDTPSKELKEAIKSWKTEICMLETVNNNSQDYISININTK